MRSHTMKNTQGVPSGRGQTAPESLLLLLPLVLLRSCLGMCFRWRLHSDAVVWTGVVVEEDEARDTLKCILIRLEAAFTVDNLRFEYAVHTLCYGVVRGFVVLRHADPHMILLQFVRIVVAAVLHASVRVMDESFQFIGRSLRDGHPEGLQRVFCLQRLGQTPAHDLVRVGIRHQVQVAAVAHQVDVRDVAHPQLVRPCRHEAADEVLVLAVAVVRVRRTAWLGTLLHQPEVAQQPQERVPTRHPAAKEHAVHHQPELVVADAGILLSDYPYGIHDTHHAKQILAVALILLIVRLFSVVKQAARVLDGIVFLLTKALYRLTPDFFRILIPCSSAMSISVFSA